MIQKEQAIVKRVSKLRLLAEESIEGNNLQEAMKCYFEILKIEPENAEAIYGLGIVSNLNSNHQNARELTRRAIKIQPLNEKYWFKLIELYTFSKMFREAEHALSHATEQGFTATRIDNAKKNLERGIKLARNKFVLSPGIEKTAKVSITKPYTNLDILRKENQDQPRHEALVLQQESFRRGEYEKAKALSIKIITDYPRHQFTWKLLGVICYQLAEYNESEYFSKKSLQLDPSDFENQNNLGVTLMALGRPQEAERHYKSALKIRPEYTPALVNLANALRLRNAYDQALECCKLAISIKPNYGDAYNTIGAISLDIHNLDDAERYFLEAINVDNKNASYLSNLGNVLKEKGLLNSSLEIHKKALKLNDKNSEIKNSLGVVQQLLGKFDDAKITFNEAIRLNPNEAKYHSNMGSVLRVLGDYTEAERSYRTAISLKEDNFVAYSNLLFLFASSPYNETVYRVESQKFGKLATLRARTHGVMEQEVKSFRKKRVGFVSGDLRRHPVGYFLEALIIKLAESSLEIIAYPTTHVNDDLTNRIKPYFSSWKPITLLSDLEAYEKIRNDRVDVLIDLSGHTAGNRLPLFAFRPAPVQVTWLGFFASTGLKEMDFILGDQFVTPLSESANFIEKIYHLPDSYLCFTAPNENIAVKILPALEMGYITFGNFNSLDRMNDDVVRVWARILTSVKHSKLFLKCKSLDSDSIKERTLNRLNKAGISKSRVIIEGYTPRNEYLEAYNQVDIALSPFPYGGGTTSVEGLWMGVPVVTMSGSHFLSHLGESIAHNSGLSDWIASDEDEYVSKAIAFASDHGKLANLRSRLREKIESSPLLNAEKFASNFEAAIKGMWDKKFKDN